MKFREVLIKTTPSAKVPANNTPIAVSSFTRRFVARSAIETAVRIPKANAPRRMLSPRRNAITMPGKMAWERASPMNERPRRTT